MKYKNIKILSFLVIQFLASKALNQTDYWNQKFDKGTIYTERPSKITKQVSKYIKGKHKILVIGGAYGRNAAFLANQGFDVTVIDISQTALDLGNTLFGHLNNLHFKKQNLLSLDFKDKSFDAIVGIYILNLFSSVKLNKIILNLKKILKDNGYFCCNFLSPDDDEFGYGKKIGHNTFIFEKNQLLKFYEKKELNNLFHKHGFIIDKIYKEKETRLLENLNKNITSISFVALARKK